MRLILSRFQFFFFFCMEPRGQFNSHQEETGLGLASLCTATKDSHYNLIRTLRSIHNQIDSETLECSLIVSEKNAHEIFSLHKTAHYLSVRSRRTLAYFPIHSEYCGRGFGGRSEGFLTFLSLSTGQRMTVMPT